MDLARLVEVVEALEKLAADYCDVGFGDWTGFELLISVNESEIGKIGWAYQVQTRPTTQVLHDYP